MGHKITIDFYYFSGTGNTLLIVKKLIEVFKKYNYDVNLYKLEKSDPVSINKNNMIGFVFPVAIQSTYLFIWDFFKSLPETNGTRVFMVDTLHSYSGAVVGPLKRLLLKKGYKPVGAIEINMVNNFSSKNISNEEKEKIINKGLKKAVLFGNNLINGKTKWGRIPVLSDIFYYLVSRKFLWNKIAKLGSKLMIDKDKCIKCGICVKLCPVYNIVMDEYPLMNNKCQLCMKCISFCPKEAINMPFLKNHVKHKAVNLKDMLD